MGKGGRTLNPADAQRKAERKKEVNKNKANRTKAREIATVKKDTRSLETEVQQLEEDATSGKIDKNGREKLKSLREEIARIKKAKSEYVEAHPEHAKLVYPSGPPRERREAGPSSERPATVSRSLFGPNGLPLHPERSIYYDAVMNPYGVPPPGMPYVERPLLPHELPPPPQAPPPPPQEDSEDSDDDDSIPLPAGPPPLPTESDDSDDDEIPMPEGPPRGTASTASNPPPLPPLPPGPPPPPPVLPPPSMQGFVPPPPPGAPPGFTYPPPSALSIPPPPPGFPPPPPPPGFPQQQQQQQQPSLPHFPPPGFPPPPLAGFPNFAPNFPPQFIPPPPPGPFPNGPRGGQQPRQARMIQDPLAAGPQQTYQGHRAMRQAIPPASAVSAGPSGLPPAPRVAPAVAASAVISAEPELRDLKRESTAFVPAAVKKRKTTATTQIKARVNAAPGEADGDGQGAQQGPQRPDLMATLRNAGVGAQPSKPSAVTKPKDDYDDFLADVGDILG